MIQLCNVWLSIRQNQQITKFTTNTPCTCDMHLYVDLSIDLSIYLHVYWSVYLSVYLFTVSLYIYTHIICVYIYVVIYIPIYLSIYLSIYLYIYIDRSNSISVCIYLHNYCIWLYQVEPHYTTAFHAWKSCLYNQKVWSNSCDNFDCVDVIWKWHPTRNTHEHEHHPFEN